MALSLHNPAFYNGLSTGCRLGRGRVLRGCACKDRGGRAGSWRNLHHNLLAAWVEIGKGHAVCFCAITAKCVEAGLYFFACCRICFGGRERIFKLSGRCGWMRDVEFCGVVFLRVRFYIQPVRHQYFKRQLGLGRARKHKHLLKIIAQRLLYGGAHCPEDIFDFYGHIIV